MKPLLLDLFCGAGGASMGYHQAGFKVVGVDHEPQGRYPFEFHQADAFEFPVDGFDVIHASPPCQRFSVYHRNKKTNMNFPDLVAATRDHLIKSGVKHYVIENVPGAPLMANLMLCGTTFGLDVRRHRLFETTLDVASPPCQHPEEGNFPPAYNRVNNRMTAEIGSGRLPMWMQANAMGIHWMTRRQLSQAIPPAYTKWIGERIMEALNG